MDTKTIAGKSGKSDPTLKKMLVKARRHQSRNKSCGSCLRGSLPGAWPLYINNPTVQPHWAMLTTYMIVKGSDLFV